MSKPIIWCAVFAVIAMAVWGAIAVLRGNVTAPDMTAAQHNVTPSVGPPPATTPPSGVVAGIQPHVLERYRTEATAGDAAAQDNLAVCYEQGLGMPADPVQAAAWYRKSAAQGFSPAQYHLGECFEHGRGVDRDLTQAIDLYRKAAGSGLGQAKTALTRLGSSDPG